MPEGKTTANHQAHTSLSPYWSIVKWPGMEKGGDLI